MVDSDPNGRADPGIALTLGSAFLGMYAHTGFLCGLNQAGIFPGHLAGASAGAIAGGFYAAGLRGPDLEKAILAPAFKRSFADPGMLVRWLPMLLTGTLTGVMSGRRMVRYLQRVLPVANIEETTPVKLSIAVTDLANRQGLMLTRGPLAESIMASCSVPLLFSSQNIGGRNFHDGGVLHELPFEHFVNDPAIHTIIVHSLSAPATPQRKLKVLGMVSGSHKMLNTALVDYRLAEARRNGKRVILIETEHPSPGFFQSKETKKRYFEKGIHAAKAAQKQFHQS